MSRTRWAKFSLRKTGLDLIHRHIAIRAFTLTPHRLTVKIGKKLPQNICCILCQHKTISCNLIKCKSSFYKTIIRFIIGILNTLIQINEQRYTCNSMDYESEGSRFESYRAHHSHSKGFHDFVKPLFFASCDKITPNLCQVLFFDVFNIL